MTFEIRGTSIFVPSEQKITGKELSEAAAQMGITLEAGTVVETEEYTQEEVDNIINQYTNSRNQISTMWSQKAGVEEDPITSLKNDLSAKTQKLSDNIDKTISLKAEIQEYKEEAERLIQEAKEEAKKIEEDAKKDAKAKYDAELTKYQNSKGEISYDQFKINVSTALGSLDYSSRIASCNQKIANAEVYSARVQGCINELKSLNEENADLRGEINDLKGELEKAGENTTETTGNAVNNQEVLASEYNGVVSSLNYSISDAKNNVMSTSNNLSSIINNEDKSSSVEKIEANEDKKYDEYKENDWNGLYSDLANARSMNQNIGQTKSVNSSLNAIKSKLSSMNLSEADTQKVISETRKALSKALNNVKLQESSEDVDIAWNNFENFAKTEIESKGGKYEKPEEEEEKANNPIEE